MKFTLGRLLLRMFLKLWIWPMVVTLGLFCTVYWLSDYRTAQQSLLVIQSEIQSVQALIEQQSRASSVQARSSSTQDSKVTVEDRFEIELAALGLRLRVVREASWSAILKICSVWIILLFSIPITGWLNNRLNS